MKSLVAAGALAALAIAMPGIAQADSYNDGTAVAPHPNDVVANFQTIGRDPDLNIRFALWREYPSLTGE
jgi:hypothetical protein